MRVPALEQAGDEPRDAGARLDRLLLRRAPHRDRRDRSIHGGLGGVSWNSVTSIDPSISLASTPRGSCSAWAISCAITVRPRGVAGS